MRSIELKDIVEDILPDIDHALSTQHMSLKQRPFLATNLLLSSEFIEIEGDTKEDILKKPWFKHFYSAVYDWYLSRYGKTLLSSKEPNAPGIVLIYETPFELSIPLIVNRIAEQEETFWVVFPNEVLPEENVINFIVSPPNIDIMNTDEKSLILNKISAVVRYTRSTHINIVTAYFKNDEHRKLAQTINVHIHKAVKDILSLKQEIMAIAVWEMHLAIEKALKVFLRQKGIVPPNTHNINELNKLTKDQGYQIEDKLLNLLPSDKEAIRMRYVEGDSSIIDKAVTLYYLYLKIVASCTKALDRKRVFENAAFLLKKPDWI